MAENLDINVNVNTTSAQQNISALTKKIDGVNATFLKLRTVVASISFSQIISNALQFAQALQQASSASGIALTTVTEFANSVQALGGDAQKAAGDMVDFVSGLDSARQGSASAQSELAKVGITLSDLSKLSEEEIFKKTLSELSKIEDASKRNALAVKLLGKSFKDIDVRAVAQGMGTGAGGMFDASAIRDAAEAQKRLNGAMAQMQATLLQIIQPIAKFINGLDPQVINNFADTITRIIAVLTVMWGWGKLVGAAITYMTTAIVAAGIAGKTFITFLLSLAQRLVMNLTLFGKIISILALLNTGIKAITGVDIFDNIASAIGNAYNKAKDFLGIVSNIDTSGMGNRTARFSEGDIKRMEEYANAQKDIGKKVIDANRGQALEANKVVQAYKLQNGELQTQMQFQNSLIGKDEDYATRQTKMFEVQTGYISQINQLRTRYLEMQAAAAVGTDEEKSAFAAFASVYQSTISNIAKEYENQNTAVSKLLNQEQILRAAEKDRQDSLTAITQQMERQATLGDQIKAAYDKLGDVNFEQAQMKRSPLEKQYAQIQEDARKAALSASQAFASTFEGMDLSTQQAKQLADGLEQIAKAYGAIADAQSENLTLSRTWEQGWKDAFDNYMDNATNAATRAGEVFGSITNNMNSAIDKFVENGKFSFGDLATSIIKDLLKIELKAQATQLFKAGAGGLGTLFSGIGSIFGFANGGQPPINKPSIVGENGPELFVPKTAGTVIPNGQGMGSVVNNYITNNNVSAIDGQSVARFFAENRRTMLGSMQLAQKELPYGNR